MLTGHSDLNPTFSSEQVFPPHVPTLQPNTLFNAMVEC